MNVWDSIQAAARDLQVSERTGWRWLKKGKIQKVRKDGLTLFTLVEDPPPEPSYLPTTDGADAGIADVAGEAEDRDFVTRKKPRPQREIIGTEIIQPTMFPPDEEMIEERKQTFVAEQRERRARAQRNEKEMRGTDISPALAEKKAKVEITKLDLDEYETLKRLENLKREEKEMEARENRRNLIEKIKTLVLPPSFRAELPPDICLGILNEVSLKLGELDMSMLSGEEVLTHAVVVRNRFFAKPEINEVARLALMRSLLKDADAEYHRMWESWREAKTKWVCDLFESRDGVPPETTMEILVSNNCFSYNDFMTEFFSKYAEADPRGYSEMVNRTIAFNKAMEELKRPIPQPDSLSLIIQLIPLLKESFKGPESNQGELSETLTVLKAMGIIGQPQSKQDGMEQLKNARDVLGFKFAHEGEEGEEGDSIKAIEGVKALATALKPFITPEENKAGSAQTISLLIEAFSKFGGPLFSSISDYLKVKQMENQFIKSQLMQLGGGEKLPPS